MLRSFHQHRVASTDDVQKATRDAISALHLQTGDAGLKASAEPQPGVAVVVKDSGDAKSKVDCLFLYGVNMTWASDIAVQACVITDSELDWIGSHTYTLSADYAMLQEMFARDIPAEHAARLHVKDLALVFSQTGYKFTGVKFDTSSWTAVLDYGTPEAVEVQVLKIMFSGALSFLLISESNEKQEITLEPAAGVTGVAGGLNISIQSKENLLQKIDFPVPIASRSLATASPGLSITLKGWESVKNKVELIFEAADPEQIVVNGQEGLENVVSVKKASISDRPQGPGTNPSNPGGKPEDPDDTNIGLIVGIVVAVVAVIIIVVVLVYIFVVRKKKQESSNSGAQETASA